LVAALCSCNALNYAPSEEKDFWDGNLEHLGLQRNPLAGFRSLGCQPASNFLGSLERFTDWILLYVERQLYDSESGVCKVCPLAINDLKLVWQLPK